MAAGLGPQLYQLAAGAEALARYHAASGRHGDLHPGAIAAAPDGSVTIRPPRPEPSGDLAEVLRYAAPAVAGRIPGDDVRDDLYSLGAIMYEALAGRPPFAADDALGIVHQVLAVDPVPLATVRPDLPQPVVAIAERLLEKARNRRYASAASLAADLRRCADEVAATGTVAAFDLGTADRGAQFAFPARLYGRDDELRQVLDLIDRGIAGDGQVCLISGPAGTGKTALVRAARAHTLERGALFVEGKFDQYRPTSPYSAIMATAAMALEQVLTRPASEVARWRAEVLVALDDLAPTIAELLPEVELLIGPQPAPTPLPPAAGRPRVQAAVRRLFSALATAEHPVVAFIDDLQWSDPVSIELIGHLAAHPLDHVVVFAAARRDEPGSATEPDELDRVERAAVIAIRLGPIGLDDLAAFVGDTWVPLEHCAELAELVLRKTGGNPFYARRFLVSLADQGGLTFDPEARRWAWDAAIGDHLAVSENVVDAVSARIAGFPAAARAALRIAAAIGSQFELDLVAEVLGIPEVEALVLLAPAVDSEVLVPVTGAVRPTLRFAHDRVLEAAYDASADELARTHLRIAETMAADPDYADAAFDVADQFNLAHAALDDPALRLAVARRNLDVGLAAMRSAAHVGAAGYFAHGIDLLPPDVWEQHYELARDLHLHAAEAESLLAHDERYDRISGTLLDHVAGGTDRLRALSSRTAHLLRRGRLGAAIDTVFEGLAGGDTIAGPWPPPDPQAALDVAVARYTELLDGQPIGAVVAALPPVDDVEVAAALELVGRILDPLSVTDTDLFRAVTARAVVTVLERGTLPAAGPILVCMASALAARWYPFEALEEVAHTGLALAGDDPLTAVPAEVAYLRYAFGWTRPLTELVERAATAKATAERSHGELWAAHAGLVRTVGAFCLMRSTSEVWSEPDADDTDRTADAHIAAVAADAVARPLVAAARAIAGLTCSLTDLGPDADPGRPNPIGDLPARLTTDHSARILVHALADDHPTVLALADELGRDVPVLLTRLPNLFWTGVAHAALAGATGEPDHRERHVGGLDAALRKLRRYADGHGNANVEHRIAFLEGEQVRLAGGDPGASYRAAIELAMRHEYLLEYAFLLERYGRWLHATQAPAARVRRVWEMALGGYRACEAHALVVRLERTLAAWTAPLQRTGRFDPVDTQAILSAVQTLTSERDLDALLDQLLTIMVTSAGADRGALVRRVGDDLEVKARTANTPAELPFGLIRFVLNSGQPITVRAADPQADPDLLRFGAAEAAAAEDLAAMWCVPIGRRAPYRRALYLAHTSAPDAFAGDGRRGVLDWLAEQAAISVDNAETYDELEQLVTVRTRELSDVNELLRRHQTDLRRAKDDAEAATRAKSEFLANMSHEVRTPMNAILGLTELMLREERDPVQLDRLVKLERSAATLMGLLDDILDYSKVEEGKLDLEHTAFDLVEVLGAAVQVAQVSATRKGLPVRLRVSGAVPAAVVGDPFRLGQVLRNLLGNAVKFTDSGEVAVEARATPVDGQPEMVDVTLVVRDTGVGMRPGVLARLFQPFTQADASTTRQYGGTGLGLAITSRLVALMGGRIDVASEPGVGTRFTVELRLGITTAPRASAPAAVAPAGGLDGVRVLLVEDNDLNREVATALLERFGASVTSAGDGSAALDVLAGADPTAPFDVVLMDCQMPVLDGYAATAQIRELPDHAHLPIVAMTANALPGDRERALDAGMNGHVGKPVSSAQLVHVVRGWAHPPATPDELRAAAPFLYGLDVEAALERVPDVAVLAGLLRRFGESNAGVADRVGTVFTSGDRAGAAELAHTVSGTAGMLGAHAVDEAGRQVMRAVSDGAPDSEVSQAIERLGAELVRTMRTAALLDAGALAGYR